MNDEELVELAKNIGATIPLETFLILANTFMAKNGYSDLMFEMIPPISGSKDPKWQFKYSCRKFVSKKEEGEQKI